MTDRSRGGRGLIRWARAQLTATDAERPGDAILREAGLRFVARAERVLDRLDGVTATMQRVADLELDIVRKLGPIVDDLGEIVRHTLADARERRGLGGREGGRHREPIVIDHEPDE